MHSFETKSTKCKLLRRCLQDIYVKWIVRVMPLNPVQIEDDEEFIHLEIG